MGLTDIKMMKLKVMTNMREVITLINYVAIHKVIIKELVEKI